MNKLIIALVAFAALAAGCAALPDTVTPELEHMSHATQHAPFTAHPTAHGANMANVVLGWELGSRLNLELAEGRSLDRHYPASDQWGEIQGPREQFTARLRYTCRVPK